MEIELTKENYEETVIKAEKPVLIDFWATWCGPCRMIAPTVKEIAESREDITVCKVNVDEQPELANTFGIEYIPTLVVMKNGEQKAMKYGYMDKNEIEALIEKGMNV